MFVEVMELRRERRRALESRTLAGHAKNLLGYCFSAYCLYRRAGCAQTQPASRLLRVWQSCKCVSSPGPFAVDKGTCVFHLSRMLPHPRRS